MEEPHGRVPMSATRRCDSGAAIGDCGVPCGTNTHFAFRRREGRAEGRRAEGRAGAAEAQAVVFKEGREAPSKVYVWRLLFMRAEM